jgi:hypothetical protein
MSHQDNATEDNNLLTSWKEIAVYLGRDVRTCLRWEKNFGLPIHRLYPASEKSRVFAYRDELSEWLHQSRTSRPHSHGIYSQPFRRLLFLSVLFSGIGATALLFFLFVWPGRGPKEPANFTIKGSALAILDDAGKILWRYETGLENLCGEEAYRSHFQFKRRDHTAQLPYLLIKDLNHDGRREVLFSLQTQDETGEGEVLCFDRKGRPLWRFRAGRQMKYGDKTYSGDYRTHGLLAEDLNADAELEIIVLSVHRPSWPCQFALLDSGGNLKGEYWNAGYFNDVACVDLNGDGIKEIVAGGNNNECGRGCLAIFDSSSIFGGSPQDGPDFRCPELKPGSELFYILLPRTDVDLVENYPVDGVVTVDVLENRRIQAKTSLTDLYYQFSFSFYGKDVILSHGFIQAHEKARLEGKIRSLLNSEYELNLIEGIRYWDGAKWTPEPAMNRIRKQD